MCVIIGHYISAVWCILHFGENMNQFEMEKLMRANMDICGKICTKKARNDTNSSFKCHGNILFYTSTHVNEKARSDVTQ